MPFGTLDRTPPPFFKQGPSALSKLMFFSALALFLMVADTRFKSPSRCARPSRPCCTRCSGWRMRRCSWRATAASISSPCRRPSSDEEAARARSWRCSPQRASQVEQLALENAACASCWSCASSISTPAQAAEVLYDAADPYTRKIIIDKGMTQGIVAGSPVIDESGVLGQVTRVHAAAQRGHAGDRPRPGHSGAEHPHRRAQRGLWRSGAHGGGLELRFMPANADVQEGDLLTTSGVDGVYPPGLPVAKVATGRAACRFGFCPHLLRAAGAGERRRAMCMVLAPVSAPDPAAPGAGRQAGARQKERRFKMRHEPMSPCQEGAA